MGPSSPFPERLKENLNRIHYPHTEIILRHCEKVRLQQIISTGTDRDNNSKVWDFPEDVDHSFDATLNPASITYGRTIDLTCDPIRSVWLHGKPWSNDSIRYLFDFDATKIVSVYDPTYVQRTSENEYSFLAHPKQALIGLFTI